MHPAFDGMKAGHTGLHVAPVLIRNPTVGQKHGQKGIVELPLAEKLAGRDPDSLLIDLIVGRRDAPGHPPPYIGDMDEAPGVADEPAFIENRLP